MGNVLIAIASCERDTKNGFNNAIRKTWLNGVTVDHVFCIGHHGIIPIFGDELLLDCKDDYLSLPDKTHALLKWAISKDYDHIFKCDTDTYVRVNKILASRYAKHDYIGYFNGLVGTPNVVYDKCYAWASGGSGYWLSKKAAQYIVDNPPDEKAVCPQLKYPCEDLWVGQLLGPKIQSGEMSGLDDHRYWRGFRANNKVDFSVHYCSEGMNRKFDVNWMYQTHKANEGL